MSLCARWTTVVWLISTTAHLPFPICDGDRIGSTGRIDAGSMNLPDIDYILLGCDAPDDTDDGPIDDDPETTNVFTLATSCRHEATPASHAHLEVSPTVPWRPAQIGSTQPVGARLPHGTSLGKSEVMHC